VLVNNNAYTGRAAADGKAAVLWQSSCVMAKQLCYYKLHASEIFLYGLIIVPVIDRGVFHNYVHLCKQQSTPLSQVFHLFIRE